MTARRSIVASAVLLVAAAVLIGLAIAPERGPGHAVAPRHDVESRAHREPTKLRTASPAKAPEPNEREEVAPPPPIEDAERGVRVAAGATADVEGALVGPSDGVERLIGGSEVDLEDDFVPALGLAGARVVVDGRTVGVSDASGLALVETGAPIEHFDVTAPGYVVVERRRFRNHAETPDGIGFVLMARDR